MGFALLSPSYESGPPACGGEQGEGIDRFSLYEQGNTKIATLLRY
jgi:hypothetical protein